ncbi:heavy metal translocating P-type ATPase [Roseibacillus persicicus]|uniref:Metal-transporting ATPase n=1 Tax=Roseibacillus persicicus TaxID=454148 RepID=A0A918TBW7_9BACT|nr:cation-translocating P-type ATPase [Roseibacillus persicicus]GHC41689.1 metal-transporting ATPase [Roseibacillus persicicus]
MLEKDSPDWIARLQEFLAEEPAVESVILEPERHKISVATTGDFPEERLRHRLTSLIDALDHSLENQSEVQRDSLTIRKRGSASVLERNQPSSRKKVWREFDWPDSDATEANSGEEWRVLALQAGVCGLGLLLGWVLGRFTDLHALSIACYLVALVAGGWDAAIDSWHNLRKANLDIHFLMLAVALGSIAVGAWTEGALLLFLFSASGAMEHYALHRTHREINSLSKAAPRSAIVRLPDGTEEERPVTAIEPGTIVLVKPGEAFPNDGEIEEGTTAADESTLTGEAQPVEKEPGDEVFSGTVNLWGAVAVKVTHHAADSTLQKVITLILDARHRRAPSQRFTDRFGTRYTWGVLALTTTMFFIWWQVMGLPAFQSTDEIRSAFYRAMTLLVVASPCALVLSIPSAILAGIAWAAKHGILFRGGAALEKLAEIDTVALDKTGTLTTGEMSIASIECFPPGREDELASLAYSLEVKSGHPIARAIVDYGKKNKLPRLAIDSFQSLTGKGLRAVVDGQTCYLGRRELLAESDSPLPLADLPEPPIGSTEVWVVREDLVGRILLTDQIRLESKAVLAAFAREGIDTLMLTGDRRAAAEKVATELGVGRILSGLHPEDKVHEIERLRDAGHKVAMVGDGVNDAPSLAAAHVSVAMGGRGSDAAIEQSEIVLMDDRVEKLHSALQLSRSTRRIISQNLAISLGTIIIMVITALFGLTPLTLGVLAHEGSTVIVCLNSLRLLFLKEDKLA